MIQIDINMPIGCIYEGDNGKTEYCPLCNHDDVPYCQYLDDDEAALGIDERPCYCPLYKPEQHWIPTSKERPPQHQEIWITSDLGDVELVYGKGGIWLLDENYYTEPEIIAWMPANVPSPYQPKEDES